MGLLTTNPREPRICPKEETQYSILLFDERDVVELAAGRVPPSIQESAQRFLAWDLSTLPSTRPWDVKKETA